MTKNGFTKIFSVSAAMAALFVLCAGHADAQMIRMVSYLNPPRASFDQARITGNFITTGVGTKALRIGGLTGGAAFANVTGTVQLGNLRSASTVTVDGPLATFTGIVFPGPLSGVQRLHITGATYLDLTRDLHASVVQAGSTLVRMETGDFTQGFYFYGYKFPQPEGYTTPSNRQMPASLINGRYFMAY